MAEEQKTPDRQLFKNYYLLSECFGKLLKLSNCQVRG